MASPATTLLWLSARASETLIEGSKVEVVLGAPGVLYYRRVSGYVLHWIYYFSLKSPGLTSFTLPATRLQRLIRSINLKVVGSLATRKTWSSFFSLSTPLSFTEYVIFHLNHQVLHFLSPVKAHCAKASHSTLLCLCHTSSFTYRRARELSFFSELLVFLKENIVFHINQKA